MTQHCAAVRLTSLAWLLVAAIIGLPSFAGAVACGDTVTGTVLLSTSLTGCTGNGLRVTSNNVTITCSPGVEIDGDNAGTDRGIYVDGPVSNFHTNGCLIKEFDDGVRLEDVTGGSVTDTETHHNTGQGINVTRSTDVVIEGNDIHDNGDEGIHISGQQAGNVCPTPHPGDNVVRSNFVYMNGAEGIYVLCSDNNRIEQNGMINNAGLGINVDQTATSNLIFDNDLENDGLQVKASSNNSIVRNRIFDDSFATSPPARLFFDDANANYVSNNTVAADGAADQCYAFQNTADCNQIVSSSCEDPDLYDISAATTSVNNRFFDFTRSTTALPLCSLSGSSVVDVYDTTNTLIGCSLPGADVNPASCTWWAFDELCDDGTTNGLGDVQANATSWDLDNATVSNTQYYRANTGAIRLSVTDPFVVSSSGCLSVSAATTVELHPGTEIAGRFHAVVQ